MENGEASQALFDVPIITHPQLDHFEGYSELLKIFRIGGFIANGRDDDPNVKQWPQLINAIHAREIPLIVMSAGSKISYGSTTIDFLSPNRGYVQSGELNDTGFVEHIRAPDFTALLTADTDMNIEAWLIDQGANIKSDILKVGHHGSKFPSNDQFLQAVHPNVTVIEVGAHDTYGHPAPETLARLASSTTAQVFRTDQKGTVHVVAEDGISKIYTKK